MRLWNRLDVRVFDQPGPFLDILSDRGLKQFRWTAGNIHPFVHQPLFHVGQLGRPADFSVSAHDNVFAHPLAPPTHRTTAQLHSCAHRLRRPSEYPASPARGWRWSLLWHANDRHALARSTIGALPNTRCIWPPSKPFTAGPVPVKGTCVMRVPAIRSKSSVAKWVMPPMPVEP